MTTTITTIPAAANRVEKKNKYYADHADGTLVNITALDNGSFLLHFDSEELPVYMPAKYQREFLEFEISTGKKYVAGWREELVRSADGKREPKGRFYIIEA